MATNLEKIVDDLSALTVLEAAELSKMLEEKWGVSAAAPVAVPWSSARIISGTDKKTNSDIFFNIYLSE